MLLAIGVAAGSDAPVHAAVAVLGTMLLLRHDLRLVLAPLYGAGLLIVDELGARSIELLAVTRLGDGVIGARLVAVVAVAAMGAAAAAGAAIAVTIAPDHRSVALTGIGAIAVAAVCGTIAHIARRRFPAS